MAKIAAVVVLIILFAGSIGWMFNYTALRHYRAMAPPGNFFLVEGRRMHLYCIGAGSPTVVIESGLGDDWIGWQLVQPGLARVTRVCSYDRAGLGWSDPDPGQRDAEAISDQLHELLQRAAITDALVLVGQSAGGLYVRRFGMKYPTQVVGLVLVDSTPPESFDRVPSNRETSEQLEKRHRAALLRRIKDAIGLSRLMGRCGASLAVRLKAFGGGGNDSTATWDVRASDRIQDNGYTLTSAMKRAANAVTCCCWWMVGNSEAMAQLPRNGLIVHLSGNRTNQELSLRSAYNTDEK